MDRSAFLGSVRGMTQGSKYFLIVDHYLDGGLDHFFHILGMSSSQLTNSYFFSEEPGNDNIDI